MVCVNFATASGRAINRSDILVNRGIGRWARRGLTIEPGLMRAKCLFLLLLKKIPSLKQISLFSVILTV
jgi:hypothetical protein